MNRIHRLGLAVSALAFSAAAPANAAGFDVNPVCGGNNFTTCAAVNLTWSGQTATLTITNLGANGNANYYNSVFASVGLTALPQGYTITSYTFPAGWTPPPPNDLSGAGIPDYVAQTDAANPWPKNGIQVGQTLTFTWTFSGLTDAQIAQVGAAIHGVSGPNGCSTKLAVGPNGAPIIVAADQTNCVPSNVPEPMTMTLLGTGLASMGGMGFLKRRRKQQDA